MEQKERMDPMIFRAIFKAMLPKYASMVQGKLFVSPVDAELTRIESEVALLGTEKKFFLEIPLLGEPFLDLLFSITAKHNLWPCADLPESYPYREAFQYLYREQTCHMPSGISYGFTYDHTDYTRPGFYAQLIGDDTVTKNLLEHLHLKEHVPRVQHILHNLPAAWAGEWLGYFRGREGSPLRLTLNVTRQRCKEYFQKPQEFRQDLLQLGFSEEAIAPLEELLPQEFSPFVFLVGMDILPDGTIATELGLETMFYRSEIRRSPHIEEEPFRQLMQHLVDKGWADSRWQLLNSIQKGFQKECLTLTGLQRFWYCTYLMSVKRKWHQGKKKICKFYLSARIMPAAIEL